MCVELILDKLILISNVPNFDYPLITAFLYLTCRKLLAALEAFAKYQTQLKHFSYMHDLCSILF